MIPSVDILGVRVSCLAMDETLIAVDRLMIDGKQHLIATPNPEMIVAAHNNSHFQAVLNSASVAVPDGAGLLWAAAYLSRWHTFPVFSALTSLLAFLIFPRSCRQPITERVSGIDLIERLAERHAGGPVRWFLLGAEPGISTRAAETLTRRYHGLTVVGTESGSPHDPSSVELIRAAEPDVLLVAFGHKKQETWIAKHLHEMPSVKVAIGVGGAFDFLARHVPRAPRWMRQMKLEWLWRLMREPRRMRRIWTATVTFPRLVLQQRLSDRPMKATDL